MTRRTWRSLAVIASSAGLVVAALVPAHAAATTWRSWGGLLSSAPDAVNEYSGDQDVFVRGTDFKLYWRVGHSGVPTGSWQRLSGAMNLTSNPSAAIDDTGTLPIHVFARGAGNHLYYRSGPPWTAWTSLGGVLTSGPDAVVFGAFGSVYVFARGADKALWYRHFTGTAWGAWKSLGGVITSEPGATATVGTLYVFARNSSNGLAYRTFNGTSWSGWLPLGGVLASAPDASYDGARVAVAAVGTDHAIRYRTRTAAGWAAWRVLGGVATSGPSLSGQPEGGAPTGDTYVYVRGSGNHLWVARVCDPSRCY
jgi:hypothetical protein